MIYYHFTDYKLWEKRISRKGLIPQKYYRKELIELWSGHGFKHERVIWLWPHVHENLISDFFLFQRTMKKTKNHGILLKVIIDKKDEPFLASRVLKRLKKPWQRRVLLKHDLWYGRSGKEVHFHKNVPYDLFPLPLPPEKLLPFMEIKEVITPCKVKTDIEQGVFYNEKKANKFLGRMVFKHKKPMEEIKTEIKIG